MKFKSRFLSRLEITMFAIMFRCSSAFRDVIVHCVLFLLAYFAVRSAEIIVSLSTTAARPNLLEGLATTTHLGIAGEAITNVLGFLGLLGGRRHLLIDNEGMA